MTPDLLREYFERAAASATADDAWPAAHSALLDALESGAVRAARPDSSGVWRAEAWVKQAILLGFRRTTTLPTPEPGGPFFDKPAYPPRRFAAEDGVRIVPGGSAVRRGAHLAAGVVVMPPAYVNVGAFVGQGTMVDSHALVGSCAQIGGVLEPAGARPVVVEDEAFVGALAGVFEGVVVRRRAVLAAGVVLTASTVVFDLVREVEHKGEVPADAVVVPGVRRASGAFAAAHGLGLAAPVIVKYRDAKTDAATALESALR